VWQGAEQIAGEIDFDAAAAIRPRHTGLWLAQQGLTTDGLVWDQHTLR
jgi:hypothetical protein